MNGTTQAILFLLGVGFVAFGLFTLAVAVASAFVGVVFPLLVGAAFIVPAVKSHKNRKSLRRQAHSLLNR